MNHRHVKGGSMQMQGLVELVTSEPPPLRYTVDEIVESGQRAQHRRRVA